MSLKARVALTTAYAAGLRVSEVTGLRVADIDSDRVVMRIECGKGGKERYVMLSEQLLGILRSYWRLTRPERFLFPGRTPDKPIEPTVLHAACRSAHAAAGVDKRVSVHVLRHSFATIFWRAASTSASSRSCSATRTYRRRRVTRGSRRI